MYDDTRQFLKKLNLPDREAYDLPTSDKRFPDGAHYRIEVPTVNSADAMRAVLEVTEDNGVVVNRIDDTYGIMRYTDKDLRELIGIAKEFQFEYNLSVGPRATYDTSAQRATGTPEGNRVAYRLRGIDNIIRAVEDVKRALGLGVRGILVYDEGLLWVLNEMRKAGEIPKETVFKLSAHCGHGNPAAFKVLEQLGANSINPVRDLTLPMIASLRQAVEVPIDIHVDNPKSTGGFLRTYEAPEMVRVGAPLHLKTGNSALTTHGIPTTRPEGLRMGEQCVLAVDMVHRYFPDAIQSKKGAADLRVPK
jgi:hypothetical protein